MTNRYDFCRKSNYGDNFKREIQKLMKECPEVLFMPNDKCFKAYYKGVTLVQNLTEQSFSINGYSSDIVGRDKASQEKRREENKKYFLNSFDILVKDYIAKMPKDRERRTSQVISLNNMSYDPTTFSVCGWETTISTNDVKIDGKKGGPEIDIVLLNPTAKRIIFVEYKCVGETMLKGNQNIEAHYRDYNCLIQSDAISQIKQEMIKAYKVLYDIKHLDDESSFEIDMEQEHYSVEIGFLFVDQGTIDGREAEIIDDDYNNAVRIFKTIIDDEKLLYIRSNSYNDLKLSEWKRTKDSNLKHTC